MNSNIHRQTVKASQNEGDVVPLTLSSQNRSSGVLDQVEMQKGRLGNSKIGM